MENRPKGFMNLPEKIKIGAHEVTVLLQNRKESQEMGYFDIWHSNIGINIDGTPEDIQAEVLLHEVLEAVCHFNEIRIEHNQLTAISEGIFQVIRDNDLDFRKPAKHK